MGVGGLLGLLSFLATIDTDLGREALMRGLD